MKAQVPLVLAPVLFSALYVLGTHDWGLDYTEKVSDSRSPMLVLPYLGFAFIPLIAMAVNYLWKSSHATKPVAVGLAWWFFVHCMFSTIYGNINNEAWSNSWMVDIVLPPDEMIKFQNIPRWFKPSTNATMWQDDDIFDGPHLTQRTTCPEAGVVRFMIHEILPSARLTKLLDKSVTTYFMGAWVAVEGANDHRPPKVFTDFAGGNDKKLNKFIIPKMLVDTRNNFMPVDYSKMDIETNSHVLTLDQPFYTKPSGTVKLNAKATTYLGPDTDFVMAQYSCMNEALWFRKLTGKSVCFHKFMQAQHAFRLEGTFSIPGLFDKPFKLPSGNPDDCTKPYVRAVFAKGLHWRRNNHLC